MLKEPQAQEKSELIDEDLLLHDESDLDNRIFNSFNFLFTFGNGDGLVGIFSIIFVGGLFSAFFLYFLKIVAKIKTRVDNPSLCF